MTLDRGDLPPLIRVRPPGPRSRALARELVRTEAPGVNTIYQGRAQIVWAEARGANVLDVDDNRYLDFTSGFGVAFIGHRHPAVVDAVGRQSDRLLHGLGDVAAHPGRIELARRLAGLVPVEDPRVYFAVSGSDAVEVALKTASLATGRPVILAFEPAYHGLTLGALAIGSRSEFQAPFRAHLHPHVRRLPFAAEIPEIRAALAPGDVAAVMVEPIVGREGVLIPPPGWLGAVAAAAREVGTLFAVDEIFTGFGKTGTWFAVDAEDLRPDLLVCGKALGGGLPIAATIARAEVMAAWASEGEARHTATFLAHPLAVAAALATIEVIEGESLLERAATLGERLRRRIATWPNRFPSLVEAVRGRALLQAVVLRDRGLAGDFAARARARGVLILVGGADGRGAQLVPPATITVEQLELALDLLEDALLASEP